MTQAFILISPILAVVYVLTNNEKYRTAMVKYSDIVNKDYAQKRTLESRKSIRKRYNLFMMKQRKQLNITLHTIIMLIISLFVSRVGYSCRPVGIKVVGL